MDNSNKKNVKEETIRIFTTISHYIIFNIISFFLFLGTCIDANIENSYDSFGDYSLYYKTNMFYMIFFEILFLLIFSFFYTKILKKDLKKQKDKHRFFFIIIIIEIFAFIMIESYIYEFAAMISVRIIHKSELVARLPHSIYITKIYMIAYVLLDSILSSMKNKFDKETSKMNKEWEDLLK